MNHEVKELIAKAQKIISKTGTNPGTKYPNSLKKIITSLRLDHDISVKEITRVVGVSSYSAREWPKLAQKKTSFNKVSPSSKLQNKVHIKSDHTNYSRDLKSINISLKVLIMLITLLIFESLTFHLTF